MKKHARDRKPKEQFALPIPVNCSDEKKLLVGPSSDDRIRYTPCLTQLFLAVHFFSRESISEDSIPSSPPSTIRRANPRGLPFLP